MSNKAKATKDAPFTIDKEFEGLIRPLTGQEFAQLEANLLEDGCRDALIVWANHDILIDGHHRYKICEKHNIPFKTSVLRFDTREEAKDWCQRQHDGRRNLTQEEVAYLRGRRYNQEKSEPAENLKKGPVSPKAHSGPSGSSAERVAAESGVAANTVKRDGKFAEHIDKAPPEVRDAVLKGTVKATRADVEAVANLPPGGQQQVAEAVKAGAKNLKDALPAKRKAEAEEGGAEPHEALKPLNKMDGFLTKMMEQLSAAEGILGKDRLAGVHAGMDATFRALTKVRTSLRKG